MRQNFMLLYLCCISTVQEAIPAKLPAPKYLIMAGASLGLLVTGVVAYKKYKAYKNRPSLPPQHNPAFPLIPAAITVYPQQEVTSPLPATYQQMALPGYMTQMLYGAQDEAPFFGAASYQGNRPSNEDRYCAQIIWQTEGRKGALFCGVFDGHAGHEAAEWVSRGLCYYLNQMGEPKIAEGASSQEINTLISTRLTTVFARIAHDIQASTTPLGGTTAVVALLYRNYIHIASLGDSPAYFTQGKTLVKVTQDHNAYNIAELIRIRDTLQSAPRFQMDTTFEQAFSKDEDGNEQYALSNRNLGKIGNFTISTSDAKIKIKNNTLSEEAARGGSLGVTRTIAHFGKEESDKLTKLQTLRVLSSKPDISHYSMALSGKQHLILTSDGVLQDHITRHFLDQTKKPETIATDIANSYPNNPDNATAIVVDLAKAFQALS